MVEHRAIEPRSSSEGGGGSRHWQLSTFSRGRKFCGLLNQQRTVNLYFRFPFPAGCWRFQ